MIKILRTKYFRFVFREPQFKWRIAVFVILVVMLNMQSTLLAKQKTVQKAMVMAIEKKRRDAQSKQRAAKQQAAKQQAAEQQAAEQQVEKQQVEDKGVVVPEIQYILRGVSKFDGTHYVVINKGIYAQGNTIGHYVVKQITGNSVMLEDKSTQELRRLEY